MNISSDSTSTTTTTTSTSVKYDLKNLTKWDVPRTLKWLRSNGYEDCERYFVEHKINGRALLMLDEDDLKEVIRDNVGQRKNLYHLIKTIQARYHAYMSSAHVEVEDDEREEEEEGEETNTEIDESNADDEKEEDGETSCADGDDGGERLEKNSSFIRTKIRLGSGLGLRNRGRENMKN